MKKDNNGEAKKNNVGLKVAAATGAACTVCLGVVCYSLAKDNKNLKFDVMMYRDAYEGIADKLANRDKTAELVKNVVGGPLINRLIKNEEKTLSRVDNKINNIISKGVDEVSKVVLEELKGKRQNILETIKDFVEVRDALK